MLHSGSQVVSSEIQSQPLKSQLMDKVKAFKSFQRDWFGIKIQTKGSLQNKFLVKVGILAQGGGGSDPIFEIKMTPETKNVRIFESPKNFEKGQFLF